jgi:hypothetical protein
MTPTALWSAGTGTPSASTCAACSTAQCPHRRQPVWPRRPLGPTGHWPTGLSSRAALPAASGAPCAPTAPHRGRCPDGGNRRHLPCRVGRGRRCHCGLMKKGVAELTKSNKDNVSSGAEPRFTPMVSTAASAIQQAANDQLPRRRLGATAVAGERGGAAPQPTGLGGLGEQLRLQPSQHLRVLARGRPVRRRLVEVDPGGLPSRGASGETGPAGQPPQMSSRKRLVVRSSVSQVSGSMSVVVRSR